MPLGLINAACDKGRREHLGSGMVMPVLAAVLLLLAGGCMDDSGTNPLPVDPSQQTFTVDPSGGVVEYRSTEHDVSLTLTFPPGALTASTQITVQHARDFPTAAELVTGAVFEFGPDGLTFNAPVELSITYAANMISALTEENLRIHRMVGSNWVSLLGSVDTANQAVDATLTGFSVYGLKTIPALPSGGGGGDAGGGADTWGTIQADILQTSCVLCHNNTPSAPRGLSWEADQFDAVVTDARMSTWEPDMRIIEPGNSAASYLYWKINGAGPNGEAIQGVRMPATGLFLSQAQIDRIAAWIDAGAPGTDDGTGGGTGGGGGGGGTPDPSAIVPTWYGVQANILGQFCTMCHSGSSPPEGLSWEAEEYDTIVTNARMSNGVPGMQIVTPGDPNASYMYWKITGNPGISGVQMPATGVPLDPALIAVIEQWILDGAPLGDPADADAGSGAGTPAFTPGSWMYVWSESLQVCTLCHSRTPSSERCGVDIECPPKGVVLTSDNYFGVVDGSIVRPSRLDNSELWERVTETDPDKRMPFGLDPLSSRQLGIIRDWIENGAPFCPSGEVCP